MMSGDAPPAAPPGAGEPGGPEKRRAERVQVRFGPWAAIAAALLTMIQVGCAARQSAGAGAAAWPAAPERPRWVDEPASALPGDGFRTAVGVGVDRPDAEEAAIARLAQSVRVDINSVESVQRTYAQRSRPGETRGVERISARRDVQLSADLQLPGVQIAAVYRDPERGSVYALAALDRRAAADELLADRTAALARARSAVRRAEAASSPRRSAALWRAAADHALVALDAEASWRALAPPADRAGQDVDAAAALLARIDARLVETLDGIVVAVESSGENARRFEGPLRDAARDLGLPLSDRETPAVRLRLDHSIVETPSYAPRVRLFTWRLSVEAMDARSQRLLETLDLSGVVQVPGARAGRAEAAAAASRALESHAPEFVRDAVFGPPQAPSRSRARRPPS